MNQQADNGLCPLCGAETPTPFAEVAGRRYLRCGHCRVTILDPAQLPSLEAERAEYGLHQNDPGDPGYRRFLAQVTEPLLERIAPGAEGLDFGCGPGPAIAAMLGERGHPVRNYDPLFHPDAAALERRYDFVTCTEVAEHFHRPSDGFERLDGLLRPGGWLGLMTGVLRDDAGFATWTYIRELSHVTFYRPETLTWIAGRFGWDLEPVGRNVTLFRKR
ncbi:class I SAM-dependent methyltransferase [Azospirillum sp. sgz301742]